MTVFHRLSIAAIERDTPDAVAITFNVPDALREQYHYRPGQHLTLKAAINGENLRRCYSICSSPDENTLKIGVKAIYEGRFSNFVNQELQVGDSLDVMVPHGQFGYQPAADTHAHYLAVAAGSGITPLLSIIKATLQTEPKSSFVLIYGNRNSRSVMFKESISDLKNRFATRFQVLYLFSQEQQDSELLSGRVSQQQLSALNNTLLNFKQFDRAFICGPDSMMDEVHDTLVGYGMPKEYVHTERFNTSGTKFKPAIAMTSETRQVSIHLDGRTMDIAMDSQDDSILDAALRQGADLPYACKGGVCATCKCKLRSGEVEMGVNYSLEPDQIAAGYILSCQAWPKGDGVVLDFDV
ncbi:1,2-phenylacetyl-CoA epoxidase subunit PaaE [Providencia rettgeri]|uniref:1,2-phenylacetyl-CoA epoxidase subunit PaaE n=1 Tax=Providencia rettgeri TaxID=587 RepID=UPI00235F53BA|nr:1,2-phenylacetyl-CoA epoxidase subunit PaaE [Providencia rettgeri]MDK7744993.1 phenylacetate-CoA oxygenase/reductase subunit PaaK [Providencia rettgeri]MDK7757515.1 phenylacetate-CoA oxygenase/reductase subunit PaaK [Providencia rettgeri]